MHFDSRTRHVIETWSPTDRGDLSAEEWLDGYYGKPKLKDD